jgi:hypothetical protein
MNNTRFLKHNEISILRSMFDFNPYANKIRLSEKDIIIFCNKTMEEVAKGSRHVAITMDETGDPVASTLGIEKPGIAGWVQGLTMVRYPSDYPRNPGPEAKIPQAEMISRAMDLLVSHMESKRYYKFWDIGHPRILNFAKSYVSRFTKTLNRYDQYDEMNIPPGMHSGVPLFDAYRRIHPTESMIARMYVLRQEYRLQLI